MRRVVDACLRSDAVLGLAGFAFICAIGYAASHSTILTDVVLVGTAGVVLYAAVVTAVFIGGLFLTGWRFVRHLLAVRRF